MASVSRVTACTTSRPPGRRAAQQTSRTAPSAPPPTKTASGRGRSARRVRRSPVDDPQPGHAELGGVGRDPLGPVRIALDRRWPGSADGDRAHSMPIEPAPAPTSQSSSPGRGIRWARAEARTSRLLSCPSCSYASSGNPAARLAYGLRPRDLDADHVERGHHRRPGAVPRLVGAPRLPSTVTALLAVASLGQQPRRPPPGLAGIAGEHDRSAGPGTASGGACPDRRSVRSRIDLDRLSASQPIRARARATDDTAGWIRTVPGPKTSSSTVEPMPATSGSPLASTTVGSPSCPASRSGSAARRSGRQRLPPLVAEPVAAGRAAAAPPTTSSAAGPAHARPDPATPSRPRRSRPPRSRPRPYAADVRSAEEFTGRGPAVPTDIPPSTGST